VRNEKYLSKITSQHKTKNKFVSWLKENLNLIDYISNVLCKMDEDFNIYDAKGKQQDIIGEIIGISRILDFEPADGSNPILKDDIYRTLQLAKISMNQWDGTIPGVLKLWKTLFPKYRLSIIDNQDMSMDLMVVGMTSSLEKELMIRGYIAPKPEGVRINYEFIIEVNSQLNLQTNMEKYQIPYNMCGTFLCGTKPYIQNKGIDFSTEFNINTGKMETSQRYKITGTFKSGEERL